MPGTGLSCWQFERASFARCRHVAVSWLVGMFNTSWGGNFGFCIPRQLVFVPNAALAAVILPPQNYVGFIVRRSFGTQRHARG